MAIQYLFKAGVKKGDPVYTYAYKAAQAYPRLQQKARQKGTELVDFFVLRGRNYVKIEPPRRKVYA